MKTDTRKLTYLIALFFVMLFSNSFAQTSEDINTTKQADKIKKLLNLSDDQYTKVLKIHLRNSENLETAKRATAVVKLNKQEYDKEIQEILTPEQISIMASIKQRVNDSIAKSKLPPWKR